MAVVGLFATLQNMVIIWDPAKKTLIACDSLGSRLGQELRYYLENRGCRFSCVGPLYRNILHMF
jgi:hypothetical protein